MGETSMEEEGASTPLLASLDGGFSSADAPEEEGAAQQEEAELEEAEAVAAEEEGDEAQAPEEEQMPTKGETEEGMAEQEEETTPEWAMEDTGEETALDASSMLDFATETLDASASAERTAALASDNVAPAETYTPEAADKTPVSWLIDLIEDEVDLTEAQTTANSEGGEMASTVGPEPAFELVDTLDPTTRFAEIGTLGEEGLSVAQDTLWNEITNLPGAALVAGVDLDETVDVTLNALDPTQMERLLDTVGQELDVVTELDDHVLEGLSEGQGAMESLVSDGRDAVQNAQDEALAFGQDALDAGKEALFEQQLVDHEALADLVIDGRDSVHELWNGAAGEASGLLASAEAEASGIRDHFSALIDALPSIPFIGGVVDRLVDQMMDQVLGMFDDVQGGIVAGFAAVKEEGASLVDEVRTTAEAGYQAFDEHVVDNVESFATETVPTLVDDTVALSEDIASEVASGVSEVSADVQEGVESAVDEAEGGLSDGLDWVESAGEDAVGWVEETGADALDQVEETGTDVGDILAEAGPQVWETVKEHGEDALEVLVDLGESAVDWTTETGTAAVEGATSGVDWVSEAGQVAVDWIEETGGEAVDWVEEAGSEAGQALADASVETWETVREGGAEAIAALVGAGETAADWTADAAAAAIDWSAEVGADLAAWAETVGEDVWTALSDASAATLAWLEQASSTAWEAITDAGAAVWAWMAHYGEGAWNVMREVGLVAFLNYWTLLEAVLQDPSLLIRLEPYEAALEGYLETLGHTIAELRAAGSHA